VTDEELGASMQSIRYFRPVLVLQQIFVTIWPRSCYPWSARPSNR
jgi:hypothetical protein